MQNQRLVVITGMSGAGKQLAAKYFEDIGWRVIDNLPPRLIPALLDDDKISQDASAHSICLICDVRGGEIETLLATLDDLQADGIAHALLFLDASDAVLVQRFKESRRPHPLFAQAGGILPAIACERGLLGGIKERADRIIDTTDLPPADLRAQLIETFADAAQQIQPLIVTVASFGFKHGIPLDADLVFDVRFLNNPYYVETLRSLDGRDKAVETYVFADERTGELLDRLYDLVGWSLPHYIAEGKAYLNIAIGCTGGRHRSVVISEKLAEFLRERGYRVLLHHRDVEREPRKSELQIAADSVQGIC